jgi:hypothetical protein
MNQKHDDKTDYHIQKMLEKVFKRSASFNFYEDGHKTIHTHQREGEHQQRNYPNHAVAFEVF